jgi:hypothetical protein
MLHTRMHTRAHARINTHTHKCFTHTHTHTHTYTHSHTLALTLGIAGQALLLPLTSSLYVSGTVASTDQVLVDIGTGYYVEVRDNMSCVSHPALSHRLKAIGSFDHFSSQGGAIKTPENTRKSQTIQAMKTRKWSHLLRNGVPFKLWGNQTVLGELQPWPETDSQ